MMQWMLKPGEITPLPGNFMLRLLFKVKKKRKLKICCGKVHDIELFSHIPLLVNSSTTETI